MTSSVYPDKLTMVFIQINQAEGAAMKDYALGAIQERFADVVWAHEPIASGELAKICERELGWKRPTTYTVLRKLCEKGLLQNRDGTVASLVPREAFYAAKSERIIRDSYRGSLPAFIASFISRKAISAGEADEIQKMIDAFRKEG